MPSGTSLHEPDWQASQQKRPSSTAMFSCSLQMFIVLIYPSSGIRFASRSFPRGQHYTCDWCCEHRSQRSQTGDGVLLRQLSTMALESVQHCAHPMPMAAGPQVARKAETGGRRCHVPLGCNVALSRRLGYRQQRAVTAHAKQHGAA